MATAVEADEVVGEVKKEIEKVTEPIRSIGKWDEPFYSSKEPIRINDDGDAYRCAWLIKTTNQLKNPDLCREAELCVDISKAQYESVLDFVNTKRQSSEKWSYVNNCTTFVDQVFTVIGVPLNTGSVFTANVSNLRSLITDILKKKAKQSEQ